MVLETPRRVTILTTEISLLFKGLIRWPAHMTASRDIDPVTSCSNLTAKGSRYVKSDIFIIFQL